MNIKDARILIIYRRTRLAELIARHNTLEQARFYVERLGGDFDDYVKEDGVYRSVLDRAEHELSAVGRVQRLERGFLPNYLFAGDETIVVIGQDGLVANTLKYLDRQPVIAINPDPKRYEGVLLPFEPADLLPVCRDVQAGRRPTTGVTMAEATLSDGQQLLAVNDFFIGPRRHTTAAYSMNTGGDWAFQMSSGVIVSTGLGSTGWLRSIVSGAERVAEAVGWERRHEAHIDDMRWDSRFLVYVVREPYAGATGQPGPVIGRIDAQQPFALESAMAEEGVIFSDGMLDDALVFNAGSRVTITLSQREGRLVCE